MSNTDANTKSSNQLFSAAIENAAFGAETGYGGRVLRGWKIAEKNRLRLKADGSFLVPSDKDSNQKYNVKLDTARDRFTCECDDFMKNHPTNPLHYCKHIFGVISWITSNSVLLELLKGEEEKSFSLPHCPKCESSQVIRYGTDNGRKCFLCTSCGHRFRGQRLLHHGHYNEKIVSLSFDLYFSGLSYRAVAGIINKHLNMNIDHSTIVKWMDRFIPIVSEYVDSLIPHLSGIWQADELYTGVTQAERLGKGKWKGKRIAYLWDVMDRGTRMLLASMLYRFRDSIGAKKAFEKAIATSQEQSPETVITDKHKAYRPGINKAWRLKRLKSEKPQHIQAGVQMIKNSHGYTVGRIERLHGTLRDRTKTTRSWKSFETPLPEGQRIHYNMVRPHQALEGQTPALRAFINNPPSEVKNKWGYLLAKAVEYRRSNIQTEL